MNNKLDDIFKHQNSKRQKMQSGKRLRQSLVIVRRASCFYQMPESFVSELDAGARSSMDCLRNALT